MTKSQNNFFEQNSKPKKNPSDILNAGKPQDNLAKEEIAATISKEQNVIPIKKEETIIETQQLEKQEITKSNTQGTDDDFLIEIKEDKKEKDYINFYLKIENIEKLKQYAKQTGKKQSPLLDEILEKAFKRLKIKEK